MGKKSLTKSTTKKKTTTPKKNDAPKKSAPPKKQVTAAPSKPAAPPKKTKSSVPKKSAATQKPTISSLIQKDFGAWLPKSKYMLQLDPADLKNFTAPAFIVETNPNDAQRIKTLLAKEFDLTIPDAPEEPMINAKTEKTEPQIIEKPIETPEVQVPPEPVKRAPIPISELLNLKFDDWQPPTLFSTLPDEYYLKRFSAPPFIENADSKEIDRIQALLFKTIDLAVIEFEEPSVPEIIKPSAEEKQPIVETPQPAIPPEIEEPAPEPVHVKEDPPKASPAAIKEEVKPIETPKLPEKPPVQSAPKVAAPQKEPAKVPVPSSIATSPAAKPPAKEAAAIKPLEWAEPKKPVNAFDSGLKFLAGCIAAFFAILIFASGINAGKYYLMPSETGLEIWKGKFSPSGKQLMMTVPGVQLTEPLKQSYTKEEALTPAFNYYLRQADELSGVKGTPDFEAIKVELKKALDVAPTQNDRELALKRLNTIDFTFLLYKANAATRKKTPENIEKALVFLNEAKILDLDDAQRETLEKKINELNPPIKSIKPQETPKGQAAPNNKSGH